MANFVGAAINLNVVIIKGATTMEPAISVELEEGSIFELDVLEQLQPWPKNPRVQRNPLYDEIQHSILSSGQFIDVLPVTIDPSCPELYVPRRGGNTRAEILRNLAETDRRFRFISGKYHSWPGDLKMLSDALQENTNRGANNTLDEACALSNLLDLLAVDRDNTSTREICAILKQHGHTYSRKKYSALTYLSDKLAPCCELVMATRNNGAGPSLAEILKLKNFEEQCRVFWEANGGGSEFLNLYYSKLSSAKDVFDMYQLTNEISAMISEELGKPFGQIQSLLLGETNEDSNSVTQSRPEKLKPIIDPASSNNTTVKESTLHIDADHLASLRSEIFDHALLLAASVGLKAYVIRASKIQGFALLVPKSKLNKHQCAVWWFLFSIAEHCSLTHTRGDDFINPQELEQSSIEQIESLAGKPVIIEVMNGLPTKQIEVVLNLIKNKFLLTRKMRG